MPLLRVDALLLWSRGHRPLQPCAPSEPCQPLELVPMALMVTLTKVNGTSHGYWPRHLFSYFADLLLQICDTLV